MGRDNSAAAFKKAQQLIPGGVNSPVRAFRSVGGQPRFIRRAKGARLYCVPEKGYSEGRRGSAYNGICPVDLEPRFLRAYRDGQDLYRIQANIDTAASAYIPTSTYLIWKRSASQPPPTAPSTAPKFSISTKFSAEPRL